MTSIFYHISVDLSIKLENLTKTKFGVFHEISACQEKRTENVKHSPSFSCQFEYTALWKAPLEEGFLYRKVDDLMSELFVIYLFSSYIRIMIV